MSANKRSIETLKRLRTERRETVATATARMKVQKKVLKAIRGVLADGPATVPGLAKGVGMPSAHVLWYVAAMKKYGQVVEEGKDGGYYRYALAAAGNPAEAADADARVRTGQGENP